MNIFIFLISVYLYSNASLAQPLALIYKGPGSCLQEPMSTGCSESAALVAQQAGFNYQYVGPNDFLSEQTLREAKVWIQPGGRARIQEQTMSAQLKKTIVTFVKKGGGYVGFCAGGFLAYQNFGWDTSQGPYEARGLGLIQGKSFYYNLFDDQITEQNPAKIISTFWENKSVWIYWELGPYFPELSQEASTSKQNFHEVISRYPVLQGQMSGPILSLRTRYGRGRVFITAVHPEAPQDWRDYFNLNDPDGTDFDLAVQMIQWAANAEESLGSLHSSFRFDTANVFQAKSSP